MTQARKHRGMRSQKVLADYYVGHGWPYAESTGAGRAGVDITGMPGLAPEVKARRNFEPVAWLKQADREAGVPFVVFRPNGMGEANVGKWGVLMSVDEHTRLLRAAGYGDPSVEDDGFDDRVRESDQAGDEQADPDGADQERDAGPLVSVVLSLAHVNKRTSLKD